VHAHIRVFARLLALFRRIAALLLQLRPQHVRRT
jgi:hypothetical protein